MKVYFQGVKGAYSEEAAMAYFGNGVKTIGLPEFGDVFRKVKNSSAYGIIPIENSTSGSVYENYDLLFKSGINVCGEQYLRIIHNLIGLKTAKIKSISAVYSHIQALLQCKAFLRKGRFKCYAVDDTANAVKMVSRKNNAEEAAIASAKAAKIYGLRILKQGIEDNARNMTRFLVISKNREPKDYNKISLVFGCAHKPGVLVSCLNPFKKYGINITKIEARPIAEKPWEYVFYLDVSGNKLRLNIKKALKQLRENTNFIKLLGKYNSGTK